MGPNIVQKSYLLSVSCLQYLVTHTHTHLKILDIDGLSNYTYNELLSFLNIPSLEQRRMRADLILCYKMLFGHLNTCSVDFFETRPAGITLQ